MKSDSTGSVPAGLRLLLRLDARLSVRDGHGDAAVAVGAVESPVDVERADLSLGAAASRPAKRPLLVMVRQPTKIVGWIGKVCAGWFLVVKGNLESVRILETYGRYGLFPGGDVPRGRSGPGPRLAIKDLRWIASDRRLRMSVRREAILSYTRVSYARARIGAKSALKDLKAVKNNSSEEGIRRAAEEAIRLIRATELKEQGATTKAASLLKK